MKKTHLLAGLLGLALTGCIHPRHTLHPHVFPPGHVKHVTHVHYEGCEHEFVGGVWVTVGTRHPGRGHGRKR